MSRLVDSVHASCWRWLCIENIVIGVGCDYSVSCIGRMSGVFPYVGNGLNSSVGIAMIWRWDTDVLGSMVSVNYAT